MPLPELTRRLVEDKLGAFCQRRVPPHARDQIKVSFKIRGNTVTIYQSRLGFPDFATWVDSPVAQFRFDPKAKTWELYQADRNGRWGWYIDTPPTADLDRLLAEVDEDPTGIFWG